MPLSTILRRLGQSLLVVVLTYVFVYAVLFVLPGDPIESRINNPQNPIPEDQAQVIINYYNLDKPPLEQFWISVSRILQGDLGYSLRDGRQVNELLAQGIGQTLALAALALVLAIILALLVAFVAVFAPWPRLRSLVRTLPALALATPGFLVGLLLLQLFAYSLGWFSSIRDEGFKSLLLPAITLAIGVSAPIAQVLIQGLTRASKEPFVTVLRASGTAPPWIIGRHILKNGAIPAITLLGLTVGELLAGSVIAETIFSRTGLGFLTEQSVRAQDGPVVLAVVMFVSIVFTTVNLVTDLVYPLIDPRLKTRRGTRTSARDVTPAAIESAGDADLTASAPEGVRS
ncbi:ABC transporter permease [Microbacterium sp. NIBRBAC000506063]|uniref:ABC transporter permease n=1 Tax=Microbacterium sp. NIBRBAC000506063 TaxID=2734618 RepID=UPI001BB7E607|nr:ABC transporter permease [Microbacterium sp. NIBRBAC000506063]QTV79144.1 ABC transporter permease [Microbacterium sp. NIBRBAC000506063]